MPGSAAHPPSPGHGWTVSPVAFVATVATGVAVAAFLMAFGAGAHERVSNAGADPGPAVTAVPAPVSVAPAAAPRTSRAEQLKALGALAERGRAAQRLADAAVAAVAACGDLDTAESRLRLSITGRSAVLVRLSALDAGSSLPVADLEEAQEAGLRAGQSYLQWALAAAWSCSVGTGPGADLSYARAVEATAESQAAERRFTTGWNRLR